MIYYICPNCRRRTNEMKLLKNSKYNPDDENLNKNKFPIIYHELLRCVCDRILSWYDMIEVNTNEK